MQAKVKKLIFIAILLTGCIITSLISTNDKEKTLPGSSLPQSAQGAVASKAAQVKTVRVQVSGAVLEVTGIVRRLPGNRIALGTGQRKNK